MNPSKKSLVILSDNFPLFPGEYFLKDELNEIGLNFEQVYIIIGANIQIPEHEKTKTLNGIDIQVITVDFSTTLKKRIYILIQNISFSLIQECWKTLFKKGNYKRLKDVLYYNYRAQILLKVLIEKGFQNKTDNTIFYSYWLDYKALALCYFKRKNKRALIISRVHGSDIFIRNHELPFRKYIINNLNLISAVSNATRNYVLSKYSPFHPDRIVTHYLGKNNMRLPKFIKEEKEIYRFASCSHFNEVKRVELIVDLLAELSKTIKVEWYHFGWGPKKESILKKIEKCCPDLNYTFLGPVENEVVLDYYSSIYFDLFLNVSSSEGLPVSIMEAISSGIPVFATDVGGTSEIVNNITGIIMKSDFEIQEGAKAIIEFLMLPESELQSIRNNCYIYWNEKFNGIVNYNRFYKDMTKVLVE